MGAESRTEVACVRKSNVLLVGETVQTCRRWLSEVDVTTASDDETALALADAEVDAILVSRRCSAASGEPLVSKLRERGVEAPAAVVLPADSDVEVLELGFDECIHRPLSERKVESVLDRLVARQTYNRLLRRYYRLLTDRSEATEKPNESPNDESDSRTEAELRRVRDRLSALDDGMTPAEYENLFRDLRRVGVGTDESSAE